MGEKFIKIAGVYFLLAVLVGLLMGIIHNFALTSVHAHLNLLGWVSMAIFGIIYSIYPNAGKTKLARTHFWLHNIGLPVMQASLIVMILTGNAAFTVGTIIGSLLVVVGVILFVINLFKTIDKSQIIGFNKDVSM